MFSLSRPMTCTSLAAALVAWSATALAQPAAADASAQIRRTSFGVPHIVARDERGLGYGVGYAYAQDNLCLLANEVLTVNGERSRHFGATGKTLEQRDNLSSDLFFTWLNSQAAVDAFLQAQPAPVQALLAGYASGYNRALAERRRQGLPAECGTGERVRPISSQDLVKLTRRLLAEGGVGQFVEALAGRNRQGPAASSRPLAMPPPWPGRRGLPRSVAAMPWRWVPSARPMAMACCWPTRISRGWVACASTRCT
ncbi:penicillin acylase family protein [Pseudomonas juntendi]|nr:penicillin acylase family protein [Pseudomonas juntendi]